MGIRMIRMQSAFCVILYEKERRRLFGDCTHKMPWTRLLKQIGLVLAVGRWASAVYKVKWYDRRPVGGLAARTRGSLSKLLELSSSVCAQGTRRRRLHLWGACDPGCAATREKTQSCPAMCQKRAKHLHRHGWSSLGSRQVQ